MDGDFGFRTGQGTVLPKVEASDGDVPGNIFQLAFHNFSREWGAMRRMFVNDEWKAISKAQDARQAPRQAAVWVGDKIVRGFQAADDALVNMNALREIEDVPGGAKKGVAPSAVRRDAPAAPAVPCWQCAASRDGACGRRCWCDVRKGMPTGRLSD